ncbi:SDR family oxidoreductase [Candidatus Saccharibacteria bacterium]|nr:SDR family oxidoreductase [Candidatus Saccharibacteria bacterium]
MKYALVTGANRGIGRAFALELLARGYFVFLASRNENELEEFRNNDNIKIVKLDVSIDQDIENLAENILQSTGRLDLLINNAGVNEFNGSEQYDLEELTRGGLQRFLDVNAISPILIIKNLLPLLLKGDATVANISSCRGSFHDEYEETEWNSRGYGYRSSKAALNMMNFCLATEFGDKLLTVAFHPGDVKTDMNPEGSDDPKENVQKMLDVLYGLDRKATGSFLNFDGSVYPY